MPIHYEVDGAIVVVTIDRPACEYRHGVATIATGELVDGLGRYAAGAWREEASR